MKSSRRLLYVAFCLFTLPVARAGSISFNVSFKDPAMEFTSYYDLIRLELEAAAGHWADYVGGSGTIDLQVAFDANTDRASGQSLWSGFVRSTGDAVVFESGSIYKLRTGQDLNAGSPEGLIRLQPDYLLNELWFDPMPGPSPPAIPFDKTDAYSVFLHEVGHILGFDGFRNPANGTLNGTFVSGFDSEMEQVGTSLFFVGESSMRLYGGPIPLTQGNVYHVGNEPPLPGVDLVPDLMNGIVFFRGTRYDISDLDLAMLADAGVVIIPEPVPLALLPLGLAVILGLKRFPIQDKPG